MRLAHGGHRRRRVGCTRQVVDADDGHVVRHAHAAPVHRHARTEGGLVVGGEHRGEGLAAVEQPVHRQQAAAFQEVALHDQLRPQRHAGLAQRALVAGAAFGGVGVVGRAGDVGDAPVAEAEQVARGEVAADFLVEREGAHLRRIELPAGDDDRLVACELGDLPVVEVAGEDDQAVDAPRHQQAHALGLLGRVPVAADDDRRIAGAGQTGLDALHGAAVERALDVLREDAHRHRRARLQAAREQVGAEIEPADRLFDGAALVGSDPRRAVEDARHRARRDPGLARDVQNGPDGHGRGWGYCVGDRGHGARTGKSCTDCACRAGYDNDFMPDGMWAMREPGSGPGVPQPLSLQWRRPLLDALLPPHRTLRTFPNPCSTTFSRPDAMRPNRRTPGRT